jgi:chromosome segregation ATPase
MSKTNNKSIDYLFEDPPLSNQKYALVSIVGPHMPQKCNVWGLKVRGVADTIEKAKSMSKNLMNVDRNYDVYTVEVGKFFPLAVEPHQVSNVEYQNSQLNELIKTYLENRENANDLFNKRKNEMIEEAIREGKNQEELANRPEHPVAVLQRIHGFQDEITKAKNHLADLEKDMQLAKEKFEKYTDEEREMANNELRNALENAVDNNDVNVEEVSTVMGELDVTQDVNQTESTREVEKLLDTLHQKEKELEESRALLMSMDQDKSPNVYKRLQDTIVDLNGDILSLKEKLNNNSKVNDFINKNYSTSHDFGAEPERYRNE